MGFLENDKCPKEIKNWGWSTLKGKIQLERDKGEKKKIKDVGEKAVSGRKL